MSLLSFEIFKLSIFLYEPIRALDVLESFKNLIKYKSVEVILFLPFY
jgi:hypothetical protein